MNRAEYLREYMRRYRATGKLREYERDRSRSRRVNETPDQRTERLLRHERDNEKLNEYNPSHVGRLQPDEFERIRIKGAVMDLCKKRSPITINPRRLPEQDSSFWGLTNLKEENRPLPLPLIDPK